MHVQAALRAVEGEILELAFEIRLHLEELEPQHLRVDGDPMIPPPAAFASSTSSSALAACSATVWTAPFGDVALAACHCEMLAPRVCRQMGEAPQRAAQRGSHGPGLPGRGGPATIVWRLVSQRNQRIDRPPFDLVTPSPNPPGRFVRRSTKAVRDPATEGP
jgi:hypothetical protein